MFDWFHHGEGLTVFNIEGLCDPHDTRFRRRVTRFAGFYMNDDPGAPNYDPKLKIIRSLFNGSRGPLLRKATGLDWAGDPIEVENRFRPGHGEQTYEQMVEHFKDYNDIVGDNPLNLGATNLAINAFMLTHEPRYKTWVLEYVDAWRQRMVDNGGIIPTNIGLDGKIGGACGGKWYGGVYGWGSPCSIRQRRTRPSQHPPSGAQRLRQRLPPHRRRPLPRCLAQTDRHRQFPREDENGRTLYPHMYGDQGWYDYPAEPYRPGVLELYYWSMKEHDRNACSDSDWLLPGGAAPGYPERPSAATSRRFDSRSRPCAATRRHPIPAWPTTPWPTIRRRWGR